MTTSFDAESFHIAAEHPVVVRVSVTSDVHQIIADLGIAAGAAPVIVVCGGAESLAGPALVAARALVGPSVAQAARHTSAIVVDGATDVGVIRLVGAARAEDPRAIPTLVGVTPMNLVQHSAESQSDTVGEAHPASADTAIEPHHTHLVLVDADRWGDETPLLFGLAHALAGDSLIAVLLAGGGAVALAEAAVAARRGWPLFVLAETGGAAAQIASAYRHPHAVEDAELRTIVSVGDIRPVRGTDIGDLTRRLIWALESDSVLKDAWKLFAAYDRAAASLRRTFERSQHAILLVGILATLLALLHQQLGTEELRWGVLVAPLAVAALMAFASRHAAGKRWVAVRAAAESVKSEIFRYRTHTSTYAEHRLSGHLRDQRRALLATQLNKIQDHLMHTEASAGTIRRYESPLPPRMYGADPSDDGLHMLDAKQYIDLRVNAEIRYYEGRVSELERRRWVAQVLAVSATAAGVLVAAAGAATWVALTTALGVAPLAYLAYLQVDNTIVAYNQSAVRLEELVRGWRARPASTRTPRAFSRLVTAVEAVLTAELGMWVEEMNEAIRELQESQQEHGSNPKRTVEP